MQVHVSSLPFLLLLAGLQTTARSLLPGQLALCPSAPADCPAWSQDLTSLDIPRLVQVQALTSPHNISLNPQSLVTAVLAWPTSATHPLTSLTSRCALYYLIAATRADLASLSTPSQSTPSSYSWKANSCSI